MQKSCLGSNTATTCFGAPENSTFLWKQKVKKEKNHPLLLQNLQTLKYSKEDLQQILQLLPFFEKSRGSPTGELMSFLGEKWRRETSPESHNWWGIVDSGREGMAYMSENVWKTEEGKTVHRKSEMQPFCPKAIQAQEQHKMEAAESGSPLITW